MDATLADTDDRPGSRFLPCRNVGSESGDGEKPVEGSGAGDAVSSRHDGGKVPGPAAAGEYSLVSLEESLCELHSFSVQGKRRGTEIRPSFITLFPFNTSQ